MEFNSFLQNYQHLPVLDSKVLFIGEKSPALLQVQLSRWVRAGHIIQLRRGLYIFAPHFQKVACPQYYLAAILQSPSYISMEKALGYHGLIPEAVFPVTSVTTKRPGTYETVLGRFEYSHVQARHFWGYVAVGHQGQAGFMAYPEKALLDLVYLRSPRLSSGYLDELRLQNLEKIDPVRLLEYGRRFNKPGMLRAAETMAQYVASRAKEKII